MSFKNYIDPLLTAHSRGVRPLASIAQQVLPVLNVTKPTGKIAIYDASNLRLLSTIKAPEGKTMTVTTSPTISDAYALEEHALKILASNKEIENQDVPFDAFVDKTDFLLDLFQIAQERALSAWMATRGNFTHTNQLSSTYQWGGATDDPLGNIQTAASNAAASAGVSEDEISLVMSNYVFRKFAVLPEVLSTLGFAVRPATLPPAFVRPEQLAIALGLKQIIVGKASYNTAADGQTESLAPVWGKHCWAAYIPDQPKRKQRCFGFTCRRKDATVIERWYDNDRRGFWVSAIDEWDSWIADEKCAHLIEDACA
jgi:hypothetical protein